MRTSGPVPPFLHHLILCLLLSLPTTPILIHPNLHQQALSHLAFHSSPLKLHLATLFTPPPTIAIIGVEWADDVQLFAHHSFHVYAIEPASKFLAHLDTLVQRHPHWNVTIAPFAATNRSTGSLHLHYHNENISERVPARKLDDLVHEPLAVLSVDVQGDEYHVLQGASHLLRRHFVNSLWIEAIACNDKLSHLLNLVGHDYVLFDFVPWGKVKGDSGTDIPKSRLSFAFEPDRPSDMRDYLHWMCERKESRFQWLQTDFLAVRKQLVDARIMQKLDTIAHVACEGEGGDCVLRSLLSLEADKAEL